MRSTKHLSTDELWSLYQEYGNVHRVGEHLGVSGGAVHGRLVRAGYTMNAPNLSEADKQAIRDYYEMTPDADFRLDEIAAIVKRPRTTVSMIAKQLGLSRQGRPVPAAAKKIIGTKAKERIAKNGHPRGMLGKHHTPELVADMSVKSRANWEKAKATGTGHMSEENRQRRSDLTIARHLNGELNTGYTRTRGGKRKDVGNIYFRSSWEANIARYLNWLQANGDVYKWEYEADTFHFEKIKRGIRYYTPDFKIWDTAESEPYYWEVKGWMDTASKTRLDRMARYYPKVKLIVIGKDEYYAIARQMKYLIPEWESWE